MKAYIKPANMTNDELLHDIYVAATESFGDGIYIATQNHECGWDFLSFKGLESWEELKTKTIEPYEDYTINNGQYDWAKEYGMLLLDVLNDNGWKFEFEASSIGW